MPYDIDWEAACNDFHPAFALVRGERFVPDAGPPRRNTIVPIPPRLDRGVAKSPGEPGMRRQRLARGILGVPEVSR